MSQLPHIADCGRAEQARSLPRTPPFVNNAPPMADAGRMRALWRAYGGIGAATTLRLACASLLLQLLVLWAWALVGHYRGPNYDIYKYFADLWVAGVNVFDPGAAPYSIAWSYLDYTPTNFLVYRVLFAGGDRLDAMAFIAYQIGALALGLVLLRRAVARGAVSLRTFQLVAILVALNPFLTARVILSADDKALYFLVPIAAFSLWERRDSLLANAAIGFLGAWTGSGLAVIAWRGLTLLGLLGPPGLPGTSGAASAALPRAAWRAGSRPRSRCSSARPWPAARTCPRASSCSRTA